MSGDRRPPVTFRPSDTSDDAWAAIQERLDVLTPTDKAQLANTMSIDCERLARAGILAMEPTATEARIRYVLAERRYGVDLARAVFRAGSC